MVILFFAYYTNVFVYSGCKVSKGVVVFSMYVCRIVSGPLKSLEMFNELITGTR